MGRGLARLIFVDTSANIALANPKDDYHDASRRAIGALLDDGEELFTHNYVILETVALLQRRIGLTAAMAFQLDAQSNLRIHWVNEADHHRAVARWLECDTRRLNLVDCMSFVVMEMFGCDTAFAYDSDFETEGFDLVG